MCGLVPLPYQTVYAASKYAVLGFGEDLRFEMAPYNIKVSTVCPGEVVTMIFYRALDYSLHMEIPKPPESISIDQAADEIIAGIESDLPIIPIQDFARRMYRAISTNPQEIEETMQQLAKMRALDPIYNGEIKAAV